MTVPSFDWVVVVTPSAQDPDCAEVLCFNSRDIIKAFDEVLAASTVRNPELSAKAPIFVPLDPFRRGTTLKEGLKELKQWQREVSLASVPSRPIATGGQLTAFADRVKREYAQLTNVAEEDVSVIFQFKR